MYDQRAKRCGKEDEEGAAKQSFKERQSKVLKVSEDNDVLHKDKIVEALFVSKPNK